MAANTHIHKLAEMSGFPDSEAFHRMLECAMTDEEARFIFEMPATNADLASKFNMTEKDIEEKILIFGAKGCRGSVNGSGSGRQVLFSEHACAFS